MSFFKAGPNKSSNVYLDLVTVLMHFDRQQQFPWSDYVDVLIKAVLFELTVESSASSPPVREDIPLDPSRWPRSWWSCVSVVLARTEFHMDCVV